MRKLISSIFDCSHLAAPTQHIPVLTQGVSGECRFFLEYELFDYFKNYRNNAHPF